jgi:hypothetical protein
MSFVKMLWMGVLPLFAGAVLALSACQATGDGRGGGSLQAGIPPRAEMVQEGTGQLVYTAESPGRIYLYDVGRDRIIERYQVRSGQRVAVDARAGRVTLDGNEVTTGRMRGGAAYQLYFLPDAP